MTDHVGADGLLEPDEVLVPAPLVYTVAAAGLFVSCAVIGWGIRKVLRVGGKIDRAFDREYWDYSQ